MRRTTAVVLLLSLFLSVATPTAVQAQEGINVIYESASYTFAQEMVFEIAIESELREANLFYRIEGEVGQHYHRAKIDGTVARVVISLRPGEIPPAAEITYFWRLEDVRGYLWRTDEKSFLYLDQRFLWQSEKRGDITLFWYNLKEEWKESLVEAIFAELNLSLSQINEELGLTQRAPIKIVVYQNWYEMEPALSPHEGVIIAGAAFGHSTLIFFLRQGAANTLTHELTHLLTHQLMGEPYDYLPFWLSEGLAEYTVGPMYGLPTEVLRLSYLNSKPTKSGLLGPAYAQAQSLITFLVKEHGGKEKINQLLITLAEGTAVDDALLAIYGFDRQGLEKEWREWIGHPLPEPTALPEEETEIEADTSRSEALRDEILIAFAGLIELTTACFLLLAILFFAMRKRR